jgi:(2R)-ethylmalonyl-CoA mutase
VIEAKTAEIERAAWAEIDRVQELGGAVAAVESGYMKHALVESNTRRVREIESGERVVIGVNLFTESEPSPLAQGQESVLTIDEAAECDQLERLRAHRAGRNRSDVASALQNLSDVVANGGNLMPASIRCARAGVTTGEWTDALRAKFGEYRAPTGIESPVTQHVDDAALETLRRRVDEVSKALGRRLKLLVGKPGLDGHSSGAEQIAVHARDAGLEVVYEGIRLTPESIAASAEQEGVHLIGLSILSGSHLAVIPEVLHAVHVPVIVGGIIPEADAERLRALGVAAVYTPRDYDVFRVVGEMVEIAARAHGVEG